jgi:hypothetical protein
MYFWRLDMAVKDEKIINLEKAITELLIRKEVSDFRWITEEERSSDDNFGTCLMIDSDAHLYFWDLDGMEEMNRVSEEYGYFIDPRNYIDIGFYNLAEWRAL